MVNLFLNLLQFILYKVEYARQEDISIFSETSIDNHSLHIGNIVLGIRNDEMQYLFDPLYGIQHSYINMGLFFCKRLMHALNGDILCREQGCDFTEFVLSFPNH